MGKLSWADICVWHSPIQTSFLLLPLWLSLASLLLCQIFTSVVNKVKKCIYLYFCSTSCKLLSRIMLMFYSKVLHDLSSSILGHATLCRVSWGTELLRSICRCQPNPRPCRVMAKVPITAMCVQNWLFLCLSSDHCSPICSKTGLMYLQTSGILADLATMASCFCYLSIQCYLTYPFHSHWLVPVCFQLSILLSFLSFSSHRRL